MAERRMMSKKIIHSDAFLDLPTSTQNLYFHLLLEADDEGFVNSPKRIQRTIGASDIDSQLLIDKKFIILFQSGVIVIKHWRIHNYIQNDRFKPTSYIDERSKLSIEKNDGYKLDTKCTPSIGEDRLGEFSIGEDSGVEDIMPTSSNIYDDVIRYLNEKARTNYRNKVPKTISLINARTKEGFTLEDFKTVIDKKTSQWLNDKKMCAYLRPETLFGTKFEGYLNEVVKADVNCWADDEVTHEIV